MQARPDPRVIAWLDALDERTVYLSVLTLGELRYGVQILASGAKRTRLEGWIDTSLRTRFAGRILPVTEDIADRWGALTARARLRGEMLPAIDALLAATAEAHNLSIATRNGDHFDAAGVSAVNPWGE
jgi:predicted nucleic acid-binding protein